MKWIRLVKEAGCYVRGSVCGDEPFWKGVCICSEKIRGEISVEYVSLNGEIKYEFLCCNDAHRETALQRAVALAQTNEQRMAS